VIVLFHNNRIQRFVLQIRLIFTSRPSGNWFKARDPDHASENDEYCCLKAASVGACTCLVVAGLRASSKILWLTRC